ncbi:alkaline phosphatase D family protein, partial [Xanthovirga aplysinae]|uniref:alkaline phosphatase D family protein n=1 Tax=Xanthovirga aplysinae TaxID=2529853 RepID=UPI0012BC630F
KIERQSNQSAKTNSFIDESLYPFYHGVASGDPLSDRIIIWTRVTTGEERALNINWVMALDPELNQIVKSGTASTDINQDYTIKVDVDGLQPSTTYYYQFSVDGYYSLVGRTKTAPIEDVDQLNFAVVSCANYQEGYFSAYRKIAQRSDIDAVIHLGDYIYEYEEGGFGDSRDHEPEHEIITLEDYRSRYSYYRLDPDLRAVHQQHPFITVWDDHEFANNAYKDGAQNHQPSTEGPWNERKENAWQSYFEWMPVRKPNSENYQIYRKISYGNLVDLIMLDTRIEGRGEQPATEELEVAKNNFISTLEKAQKNSIGQQELKEGLRKYLPQLLNVRKDKTTSSGDHISEQELEFIVEKIGNWAQVKHPNSGKILLPNQDKDFERFQNLVQKSRKPLTTGKSGQKGQSFFWPKEDPTILGKAQFQWLKEELQQSSAKWKIMGNQVMMMPFQGFPSTDSWDGYEEERDQLLEHIEENDIENVVVVTGDIHMTFAGDIPTSLTKYTWTGKSAVAVEFVTPSVTSGNLNEFANLSGTFLNWLLQLFNPHIKGSDLTNHGYMLLNVNEIRIQSDWYYVTDTKKQDAEEFFGQSWYVNTGTPKIHESEEPVAMGKAEIPLAPLSSPNNRINPLKESQSLILVGGYPNPAREYINIHYLLQEKKDLELQLVDMNGNVVRQSGSLLQEAGAYTIQVKTSDLKNGMYVYSLSTGKKTITRRILVKN